MAAINDAWAILRDPVRRAAWDRGHGHDGAPTGDGVRRPGATGHGPGPGGAVAWRRGPHGEGAAGPPPGSPRGSILPFGRHIGWSLGEVARVDPGYLTWLAGRREGARYRDEIADLFAGSAARPDEPPRARRRRGPFR